MIRQPTTLSAATTVQLAHRLLVRRDFPLWPFFWRGFAPAVGLACVLWYAFFPFRGDGIEHEVRQEVRAALDAKGLSWVRLEVDGQEVRLTGREPREGAAKAAIEVAQDTRCRTWLMPVRCVTVVHDAFAKGPAGPDAPHEPALGLTPDAATSTLSAREAASSPVRTLQADSPRSNAETGRERAAGVAIASGAAPTPLSEPTTARGCEARIGTLLAGASIQFAANEATIDPASDPLLDRISQAIRACPGVVRIEGHSDTSGNAANNQALSAARAHAVREVMLQLGVPEGKVQAAGLGSARPVAPNDTPESRALNRRIEFHAE